MPAIVDIDRGKLLLRGEILDPQNDIAHLLAEFRGQSRKRGFRHHLHLQSGGGLSVVHLLADMGSPGQRHKIGTALPVSCSCLEGEKVA